MSQIYRSPYREYYVKYNKNGGTYLCGHDNLGFCSTCFDHHNFSIEAEIKNKMNINNTNYYCASQTRPSENTGNWCNGVLSAGKLDYTGPLGGGLWGNDGSPRICDEVLRGGH